MSTYLFCFPQTPGFLSSIIRNPVRFIHATTGYGLYMQRSRATSMFLPVPPPVNSHGQRVSPTPCHCLTFSAFCTQRSRAPSVCSSILSRLVFVQSPDKVTGYAIPSPACPLNRATTGDRHANRLP